MTTEIVDKTDEKITQLDLDTTVDIDDLPIKDNREDLNYYYSSGNFNFILEHGFKPETLENTELTKVPFLPKWYDGIMSIHGLIIPVINMLKFAHSQNLNISSNPNNKNYLLKLEHSDYRPIVLKLDGLPKITNTSKLKKINANNNSPEWIINYLESDELTLALVDHDKLFDHLITEQ